MNFFKKNLIAFLTIIILAIFIFSNVYITRNKNNWNVGLKNIEGNEKVLEDITIEGNIMDSHHLLKFDITMDDAKNISSKNIDFTIFFDENTSNYIRTLSSNYIGGMNHTGIVSSFGRYDYYINSKESIQIRYLDNFPKGSSKQKSVLIPISSDIWNERDVFRGNTIAYVDNKIHICPATKENYKGEISIYRIDEFFANVMAHKDEGYSKLFTFEVKDKQQVIAMDGLDNTLYILLREDDHYLLRFFDLKTNKFIKEVIIDYKDETYGVEFYMSNKSVTVTFDNNYAFAYSLDNASKFAQKFNLTVTNTLMNYVDFSYINNKLYIISTYYDFLDNWYRHYDSRAYSTATLHVLNTDNEVICSADFESDLMDDWLRFEEYNEKIISQEMNDMVYYREYLNFKIY